MAGIDDKERVRLLRLQRIGYQAVCLALAEFERISYQKKPDASVIRALETAKSELDAGRLFGGPR